MTSLLFVTISYPVILGLLGDQEEESKHKAEMTMDLKEVFSCDDKMIQKQQEWKTMRGMFIISHIWIIIIK